MHSRAVVAVSVACAAMAAVAPAAVQARTVASESARGDFAVAIAAGEAHRPNWIKVRVTASPSQPVSVAWTVICSKGFGAGSKSGQFDGRATLTRRVKLPSRNPDSCTASASGQLTGGGGRITVKVLAG